MVLSISSPKATKGTKIGWHHDMAHLLIKVLNMDPAEMEPFVVTIFFCHQETVFFPDKTESIDMVLKLSMKYDKMKLYIVVVYCLFPSFHCIDMATLLKATQYYFGCLSVMLW